MDRRATAAQSTYKTYRETFNQSICPLLCLFELRRRVATSAGFEPATHGFADVTLIFTTGRNPSVQNLPGNSSPRPDELFRALLRLSDEVAETFTTGKNCQSGNNHQERASADLSVAAFCFEATPPPRQALSTGRAPTLRCTYCWRKYLLHSATDWNSADANGITAAALRARHPPRATKAL